MLQSQILASIGQLEFFYDQAPDVMRSCSMALQLLSVAIGSYLSGALVYLVGSYTEGLFGAKHGWLPGDLNKGRVDLFFLLLGGESCFPSLTYNLRCINYDLAAVWHLALVTAVIVREQRIRCPAHHSVRPLLKNVALSQRPCP